MEALLPLLLNKTALGVIGVLIAALFIYSKGVSKGKAIEQAKQDEANREVDKNIRKAEADNAKLEEENKKKHDEIANASSASVVARLLNEIFSKGRSKTK